MERSVLHLDLVDFPASVERARDPSLRRRPLLISHPNSRSRVICASAEARSWGAAAGMQLSAARRLCPSASVLPPDERLYARAQSAVAGVLGRYSPAIEAGRWGRLFVDLSGTARLFGPARDTAQRIGREVRSEARLASLLGLSSNKSTSEVASIVGEDGLVDVFPGSEEPFLAPHPAQILPGAERVEAGLLEELNIVLIRQFAQTPAGRLAMALGRLGPILHMRSRGCDPRPVRPREQKPLVREEAGLPRDTNDPEELAAFLRVLVERCGFRMRVSGLAASRAGLIVGYSDNLSAEGTEAVRPASSADAALFAAARSLLRRVLQRRVRVCHLSLAFGGLLPHRAQPSLFLEAPADQRPAALADAVDAIRARHGPAAITIGGRPFQASSI